MLSADFLTETLQTRREWPPTPVFFPGEFHAQGSQVGYSPWGLKELDTTEQLTDMYLTINYI